MLRSAVLCLFAALTAAPAQAQSPSSPDTMRVELPEVTVEAARSAETTTSAPFAVSVRTRSPEEVNLTPSRSLDDVLRPLPGIWVNNRNHFALGERLIVRGMGYRAQFGVRGVQVMLDGIPLTLPDGQAFTDVVDPTVIREVELMRSPASVFWGNGSGGVLMLSSQPNSSASPLRVRTEGGSYGRRQGLIEGTGSVGNWTLHGYGSGHRQDGYRDHSEGYRLRTGLNARRSLGDQTQLRLTGAANYQDTENPSSLTREQFESNPSQARPAFVEVGAGKQSEQAQLGVGIDHSLGDATLSGTAYGLVRNLDNPLNYAYIAYQRQSGGGRFTVRTTEGSLQGGAGIDVGVQRDDRVNYDSTYAGAPEGDLSLDQVETVTRAAAFGYGRWQPSRLAITGGLRVERIGFTADDALLEDGDQSGNQTFAAWSPSIGLSYELGSLHFFSHYSESFETPTTTELVNRPSGGGGFNPGLQPQRTRGIETGARGVIPGSRLQFDVALFRLYVTDQIQQTGETPGGREYYENVGQSRHDGLETSLTWTPFSGTELAARYTGSRFVFTDGETEGNRVPGIPSHRGYFHLEGERNGWWARIVTEPVSSYYVDDANEDEAPGYVLFNLHLGHQNLSLGSVTVEPFAAVKNVLDERYAGSVVINAFGGRYYEPAPGRSFSVGLNVSL